MLSVIASVRQNAWQSTVMESDTVVDCHARTLFACNDTMSATEVAPPFSPSLAEGVRGWVIASVSEAIKRVKRPRRLIATLVTLARNDNKI